MTDKRFKKLSRSDLVDIIYQLQKSEKKLKDENEKLRTIDEMPQSGSGRTVMTMQPKFIPSEAVEVSFGDGVKSRVRLVDCVGYVIDGAKGYSDEQGIRYVKTPWFLEAIPFDEAAKIGTKKLVSIG